MLRQYPKVLEGTAHRLGKELPRVPGSTKEVLEEVRMARGRDHHEEGEVRKAKRKDRREEEEPRGKEAPSEIQGGTGQVARTVGSHKRQWRRLSPW
mmetsp:Transcript_7517/g.18080  ORF Transcript_7517/g.18080 Transcript_7517/m.18080 type:complete len:96 (+) Transcript_7517:1138-1425(+)